MITKFISIIAIMFLTVPALALVPAGQGRRTMSQQMMTPRQVTAPQVTASMASAKISNTNAGNNVGVANNSTDNNSNASATTPGTPQNPMPPVVDNREKEKEACIRNNIGIGNTFVWASRYSNTNDYATMVEDVQNPENNTCFVRVELKSSDSKVKVSDIPAQYFEMGRTITCGAWADEEMLKDRILKAKKSGRTWGTVGGAVGGAALGVGAMELFGNRWIGGKVEGQHAIEGDELVRSQLAVAYKDNDPKFDEYYDKLKELKKKCESGIWENAGVEKPTDCRKVELIKYMDGLRK